MSSPVEIAPEYAEVVNAVMREVAEGLESVHWYHDEPIWFIKRDGRVVVQVAAFSKPGSAWSHLRVWPSLVAGDIELCLEPEVVRRELTLSIRRAL